MSNKMVGKIRLKDIPVISLLIALEFIMTRFLSITLPGIRFGFGFLPMALTGIIYGPLWGGAAYALSDIVGAVLIPSGTGAYFPGFTITAFLTGFVYGVFLHRRQVNLKTLIIPVFIICVVLNLGLNSVWLYMILGDGFWAYLPSRIANSCIMIVLQLVLIPMLWNKVIIRVFPNLITSEKESVQQ